MSKNSAIILTVGVVLTGALVGGAFVAQQSRNKKVDSVPTTIQHEESSTQPTSIPVEFSPSHSSKSNQPDAMADWKTYTNSDYNVEFKYPVYAQIETAARTEEPGSFSSTKVKVYGGQLIIQYDALGRGINPIKRENITIDGQTTDKFYETNTDIVIKAVVNPKTNSSIGFRYSLPSNEAQREELDSLFDKILSTVRFID